MGTDGDNYRFPRMNITSVLSSITPNFSLSCYSQTWFVIIATRNAQCAILVAQVRTVTVMTSRYTYNACISLSVGVICIMGRGRRVAFRVTCRTIRVDAWRARTRFESREIPLLIHCRRIARARKWHSSTPLRKRRSLIGTASLSCFNVPVEMKCI